MTENKQGWISGIRHPIITTIKLPAVVENDITRLSFLRRYLDDYFPLSRFLCFWKYNVNTVSGKSRFKQYHNNVIKLNVYVNDKRIKIK